MISDSKWAAILSEGQIYAFAVGDLSKRDPKQKLTRAEMIKQTWFYKCGRRIESEDEMCTCEECMPF